MKPDIREITMERGVSYASDAELLMLILGSGTKEVSLEKLSVIVEKVLKETNSENLVDRLLKIKGLGPGKSLGIAAAIELGRRRCCHNGVHINSPRDIVPFVQSYSICTKEHFLCVSLSGANDILGIRVCSVGTLTKAVVHPRDIFCEPLKENAASVVVCHNHPSGNCFPSESDIETTEVLYNCSCIVGIQLLDHIIFSKNDYFSFVENNLVFTD